MLNSTAAYVHGVNVARCYAVNSVVCLFVMALKQSLNACSRLLSRIKNLGATESRTPPYEFMCQVGDPVLRVRAEPVDPQIITSPEIQKVINTMKHVMRGTYSVGISAPQVGVPLRIFMMEFSSGNIKIAKPGEAATRLYQPFPLKVIIWHLLFLAHNGSLFRKRRYSLTPSWRSSIAKN